MYVIVKSAGYCVRFVGGDKMASPAANEPFFRIDDSPRPGLQPVEKGERRRRELKPRAGPFLRAGIFRRQASPEIYGGVTAWIAMNSAHPPLSELVIVLNLLPL